MKRIGLIMAAAGMLVCFSATPLLAQEQATEPPDRQTGVFGACEEQDSPICSDTEEATNVVKRVINLMLTAIGILSVIMIIHSGLKYTASRGDAEMVKSAKNTLLYAVTGLIVAIMAFSIVNFVVEAFKEEAAPASAPPTTQAPPAS